MNGRATLRMRLGHELACESAPTGIEVVTWQTAASGVSPRRDSHGTTSHSSDDRQLTIAETYRPGPPEPGPMSKPMRGRLGAQSAMSPFDEHCARTVIRRLL